MNTALEEMLIRHEGIRLQPYTCTAGKTTIGVGRNLEANGISEAEAMFMLRNDIDAVKRQVETHLPWAAKLDEVRLDVLHDMCFNMGVGGLLNFKHFLAAMEKRDWALAAAEMIDSKWATQVGKRATRLSGMVVSGQRPSLVY